MTEATEKVEEVHVDLWGPHYPPSLSGKTYAAILLDAKTRKSWVMHVPTTQRPICRYVPDLPPSRRKSV